MNLGSGEILVVLLVALIVLGPTRLPEAARQVGRAMRTIRQVSTGFQDEVRHAMEDAQEEAAAAAAGVDYTPPPKPGTPTSAATAATAARQPEPDDEPEPDTDEPSAEVAEPVTGDEATHDEPEPDTDEPSAEVAEPVTGDEVAEPDTDTGPEGAAEPTGAGDDDVATSGAEGDGLRP